MYRYPRNLFQQKILSFPQNENLHLNNPWETCHWIWEWQNFTPWNMHKSIFILQNRRDVGWKELAAQISTWCSITCQVLKISKVNVFTVSMGYLECCCIKVRLLKVWHSRPLTLEIYMKDIRWLSLLKPRSFLSSEI